MVQIYLDILIGFNLILSWLMLCGTERLCHISLSTARRALASLLGALSSLLILLPPLPFFPLLMLRLAVAVLVILCGFGRCSFKLFLRRTAIFFGVSFLFAGFMLALWNLFSPPKLLCRNGSIYYHLSPLTLILSATLSYYLLKVLSFILDRRTPKEYQLQAKVTLDGRETLLRLMLDTGNTARTLSGLPVVFCSFDALSAILPSPLIACFSDIDRIADLSGHHLSGRVQNISYRVMGKTRLDTGFLPDRFELIDGKDTRCLIVPVHETFSDGEFDGIVGEALFSQTVPKGVT